MEFRIIPHERADAGWHLALEEALYLKARENIIKNKPVQPIIRLYSFSKPSVILGYQQQIPEVDKEFCKNNKIRVTMRSTGGGSVFLGKNELQYSLILPLNYSKDLLKRINTSIINSLQNVGFHPSLYLSGDHPVIRMNEKSFVFDAERRSPNLLLHHGTVLVENFDFNTVKGALKATEEEVTDMSTGMLWLRELQQVGEQQLIKSFEKNLPNGSSIRKKDFTSEEIKLAKKLYKDFYNNEKAMSKGKKKYGVCYLPSTTYNMEEYTRKT
ncbi:MAG: hypothetical protein ABIB47_04370 [Candidatus Woesearchaeota archaeon]